MAEQTLTVSVTSPQGSVYSNASVQLVSAPATVGRVGILPLHMPFFSTLEAGEVRIEEKSGKKCSLRVGPGFLQVLENRVEVLVEEAKFVE